MKLSIIIPVYQNEGSLSKLFDRLKIVAKDLEQLELSNEIIFVDDGSTDKSLSELMKIKKQNDQIKIIKLTRNFGAVHASKTGIIHCTGDCFMRLAADLQDPPDLIIKMAKQWINGEKFITCVRNTRKDPFLTKIFASLYYFILRALVIKDYPRNGYDLALIDKSLKPHIVKAGKNINPNLYEYWLGFKPYVITYNREKREFGKSQWSFKKKFKLFIDSLLGFSMLPLRIISFIGIISSLGSFMYGLYIIINKFFGNIEVQGFSTIVTLIVFFGGLTIFMIGLIGEYIWRIFDEVIDKPEAVIDEIF